MSLVAGLSSIFCIKNTLQYRLTGESPLASSDIEDIIARTRVGKIDFPKELWQGVSPEAKELVELMTAANQEKRITLEMALKHPWFNKGLLNKAVLVSAIDNMKKYRKEY